MDRLARLFRRPCASTADAPLATRDEWTTSDWVRVRAPERLRDRVLTECSLRWLAGLEDAARPRELSERFPRIVNRMVALWPDEGLTEALFVDLLTDMRGGRRGFSAAIIEELEALYERHLARVDVPQAGDDRWCTSTQT